jgi:hypothetical protein
MIHFSNHFPIEARNAILELAERLEKIEARLSQPKNAYGEHDCHVQVAKQNCSDLIGCANREELEQLIKTPIDDGAAPTIDQQVADFMNIPVEEVIHLEHKIDRSVPERFDAAPTPEPNATINGVTLVPDHTFTVGQREMIDGRLHLSYKEYSDLMAGTTGGRISILTPTPEPSK